MPREVAERLSARAIRGAVNLEAVIVEILGRWWTPTSRAIC